MVEAGWRCHRADLELAILEAMSDKMKAIRVASEKEFERLLNHMEREAYRASDHWRLLKGLDAATKKYRVEMYESIAFWNFTLDAHYDATLFRLARLYDQHDCSLGLRRFLLTIKASIGYFSEGARRKRLKDNPFVEGLIARKLNVSVLGRDIGRVSEDRDPLVYRLCKLRNAALSHVEPNLVRLGTASMLPRLDDREIQTLLNRACRILARYSLTYRASLVSARVVGADDYNHMLELIRRGRNSVIAEQEEEIRRFVPLQRQSLDLGGNGALASR